MADRKTEFDAMFLALVVPDLRKRCRFMGSQIALDLIGFEEAVGVVWSEARRRGALRLPQQSYSDLEDWIATSILKAEVEFRPSVIEHREVVDKVAADITRTEAKWLEIWSAKGEQLLRPSPGGGCP